MKQLSWEECCNQVAKEKGYSDFEDLKGQSTDFIDLYFKEAAELYRNQPSSLNKEELIKEYFGSVMPCRVYEPEPDTFVFDWFFSKLSAKQREVDELKEQLDEKIKEAVRMAREEKGGYAKDENGEERLIECYSYNSEEIVNKLNPKS